MTIRLMNSWITIYEILVLSMWVMLGNDMIGYYSILAISW